MDILAGVDEGPLGVLHWLIWFWYEADDIVQFVSVSVWVVSALLEEWIAEVIGLWGESLFVIGLDKTVYAIYW